MTNYVCCQNNDCENVELMNYVCRQKISNWECLLMKNVAGLYVADFTGSAVVSSSLFILITLLMWSKYYFLLQIGLISSCFFFSNQSAAHWIISVCCLVHFFLGRIMLMMIMLMMMMTMMCGNECAGLLGKSLVNCGPVMNQSTSPSWIHGEVCRWLLVNRQLVYVTLSAWERRSDEGCLWNKDIYKVHVMTDNKKQKKKKTNKKKLAALKLPPPPSPFPPSFFFFKQKTLSKRKKEKICKK